RLRLPAAVDSDVGKKAFGYLYLLNSETSANPAFDLDRNRRIADPLDIAETTHLVTDHDWAVKFHPGYRDCDDPAASAPRRYRGAGKIHLAEQPAAKDIAVRIGIGRHRNRAQCGLRLRRARVRRGLFRR